MFNTNTVRFDKPTHFTDFAKEIKHLQRFGRQKKVQIWLNMGRRAVN
jgi:hypothetical protein